MMERSVHADAANGHRVGAVITSAAVVCNGLIWTQCRWRGRSDAGKWSPDIRSKVSNRTSYVSRGWHWSVVSPLTACRLSGWPFLTSKECLSVMQFTFTVEISEIERQK